MHDDYIVNGVLIMNNELLHDETYTIGQVVMMTGLTDRTIRNYLALGFLEGEKQDGQWRFTAEQLEVFMRHPSASTMVRSLSINSSFTQPSTRFVFTSHPASRM